MPKQTDFAHKFTRAADVANFPEQIYGQNEIRYPEMNHASVGTIGIWPQFSTGQEYLNVALRDTMFDWLEENTTGAWYLRESWVNNYHSLAARVFLERDKDCEAFRKAFPIMTYKPLTEDDVRTNTLCMCRYRQIVPMPDSAQSIKVWISANNPIKVRDLGKGQVAISFTDDLAEVLFLEKFGTTFSRSESENEYVGPSGEPYNADSFVRWPGRNDSLDICNFPEQYGIEPTKPQDMGKERTYIIRYSAFQEAFARDWGDCFTLLTTGPAGEQIWRGSDKPRKISPLIPDAYYAYVRGEIEWDQVATTQRPEMPDPAV